MSKRIAFSSNTAWSLYNFRQGLIKALIARGDQVFVLAPPDSSSKHLESLGCTVISCFMDNKGTNPARDFATLYAYQRLYRSLKPDLAMHFTIKPVIYGTLAARMVGIPCINTVTGLGTVFARDTWLTRAVEGLYRISQLWPKRIFFQNHDDLALFLDRKLVKLDVVDRLPGSGVDLSQFSFARMPLCHAPVFLLIARMLWEKGIGEFIEAARQIKALYPEVRFQLLGPLGVENRSAIPRAQVDGWVREGLVEYLGETDDVKPYITKVHCVVLPSYYREGVPRALLEASAMGRPVITADSVGCREVVDDGVNGYLCEPRNANDLAVKLEKFINLSACSREAMGRAGRAKMEREFDERFVIQRYLHAIDGISPPRILPSSIPGEESLVKKRSQS